jgi:hypothetical protein
LVELGCGYQSTRKINKSNQLQTTALIQQTRTIKTNRPIPQPKTTSAQQNQQRKSKAFAVVSVSPDVKAPVQHPRSQPMFVANATF